MTDATHDPRTFVHIGEGCFRGDERRYQLAMEPRSGIVYGLVPLHHPGSPFTEPLPIPPAYDTIDDMFDDMGRA